MKKFANFEFIFATRGSKLSRRGIQGKLIKHQIRAFFDKLTRNFGKVRGMPEGNLKHVEV